MPKRGTIYAVFILRRLQQEYHSKGEKLYFVACEPRESFRKTNKENFEMGNKEERNTKSVG